MLDGAHATAPPRSRPGVGLGLGLGRGRGRHGVEERAACFSGSLTPGDGLGAAGGVDREGLGGGDRLADVVGVQPAGEDQRDAACAARRPGASPTSCPVPPRRPSTSASSRWKSVWKASQRARCRPRCATGAALMTLAPVRRATSAQKAGPSSPCSCTMLKPDAVGHRRRPRRAWALTKTPTSSTRRRRRRDDPRRLGRIAGARRARPEDAPDRPGAEVGGQRGVLERRDAADLDAWDEGHAPRIVRGLGRYGGAGRRALAERHGDLGAVAAPRMQRDLDLVARLRARHGGDDVPVAVHVVAGDLA